MAPAVMPFDAPTPARDPAMIRTVPDAIVALAGDGMTMICVTHEMGLTRAMADRILFMDEGQILEDAPPAEFFASPQTERAQRFLGRILRK